MNYIFDVDGTLTPSRMRIDKEFKEFFLEFIKKNNVYLATGSDYIKTVEQLGTEICESVTKCYNCCGNSVWQNGEEIFKSDWTLSHELDKWLKKELKKSKFDIRTGNHIEQRPGLVNFSIVGRNASFEERFIYTQWDEQVEERKTIAREFNQQFAYYKAQVAGETGLDIIPIGYDKRQIADDIEGPIIFFGDKMAHGGNDYPLAEVIQYRENSWNYEVKSWKDTHKILISLSYNGLQ
jgi:phosphomannomutase